MIVAAPFAAILALAGEASNDDNVEAILLQVHIDRRGQHPSESCWTTGSYTPPQSMKPPGRDGTAHPHKTGAL